MRKIAKTLLTIVGAIIVYEVVDTALHTWVWRSRSPRALHLVKRYNKYVENPVAFRVFGRAGPSAIVHHIGRRSGAPRATPVIAHRTQDEVVIPLPYGTDVDWLRNVLTAGQAVVDLRGRSFGVDEPLVVDIEDVIDLLPASMAHTIRFSGAREAVRLRLSPIATPESPVSVSESRTTPRRDT